MTSPQPVVQTEAQSGSWASMVSVTADGALGGSFTCGGSTGSPITTVSVTRVDLATTDGLSRSLLVRYGTRREAARLAAIAATNAVGCAPQAACEALAGFRNVKRRLELLQEHNGVRLYDDFAHHPTAVRATLEALRTRVGAGRILAVLEPRSNTMRLGVHKAALADALRRADRVYLFWPPDLSWDLAELTRTLNGRAGCHHDLERLAADVCENARPGDHIVLMSNGSFGDLRQDLAQRLRSAPAG